MREYLSFSDISNEMSMLRSVFKGTFLVVEGSSDSRLYNKFTDCLNVRIIVAHSKNNVVNSVSECRVRRKDPAVLGVVDSDMDPLLGKTRKPPIFCTDRRDMESTIMSTPAIHAVLSEYGEQDRMKEFVEKYGDIPSAVMKAACPLGYLMYISYKKGMNLSFKDIDHSLFVNPRTLQTDIPKLVATVYGMSMNQRYPRAAISEQIQRDMEDFGSTWDIARGHDAVSILRLGLRFSFGSYVARNLTDGELGGALRLAYSKEEFVKSRLYRATKEWCDSNRLVLWNV